MIRWYMAPRYSNRRSVPTRWHAYEVDPALERRLDYTELTSLCGRTERFIWRGALVDSEPHPLSLDGLFMRARWKQVCSACRKRAPKA